MLKISISGVRGTVPDFLTPEVCLDFAKSFGTYLNGGVIVIGRDTRTSGEFIKGVVISGLLECGCKIIDLGIATTPTVGIMVRKLKADGGLIITASHNPEPWNGLKFVREDGIFLNAMQAKTLIDIYHKKAFKEKSGGRAKTYSKSEEYHIAKILKHVNARAVRRAKFKVAIDSCNGAGSVITPLLLKHLGCKIMPINTIPKTPFPRGTEPTPENIEELKNLVKNTGADIGFAQDPDADRLAVVTEEGDAVSEEYTLALCVKFMLSQASSNKKLIVTNLSTTAAIDDIAKPYGALVLRTKIGEVYVAEEIKKEKALIGGEGNGGVILPPVGYNRDSLSAIALILALLAKQKKKLSEIISQIPKYFLVKMKMECKSEKEAALIMERIRKKFQKDTLDLTEGIKVIRRNSWLHARPSNTEPIVRIFAEAKDSKTAESFIKEALEP